MANTASEPEIQSGSSSLDRLDILPKPLRVWVMALYAFGIGLFVYYLFGWSVGGLVLEDISYYYLLFLTFVPCVFLTLPASKKDRTRLPWYDLVLAVVSLGTFGYVTTQVWSISRTGWVPPPSMLNLAVGCIIALLALEAGRRRGGLAFVITVILVGTYPLYAGKLGGMFWGVGMSFPELIGYFSFSRQGALGLPAQVMGEMLIGYLIFSAVLQSSGAGRFFLNSAMVLMGRYRGGPAKVAVVASGFVSSMTGSSVMNVVTTGCVTIPAMKRIGYPPYYAAAVEAVASSGSPVTPPVMGTNVFIMAVLTGIPYAAIMLAAVVPAILYYWGCLTQVDAYAAKKGLVGLPREEIPSLYKTLKDGWPFIFVMAFLVFGLVYMRWGTIATLYASGLMILLSYSTRRENWMTPKKLLTTLASTGGLITYIVSVLLATGFILIGIMQTGSLTAFTAQLVAAGASNPVIVMVIAAVAAYLFGMLGAHVISYILLAVTAIPAIITATGLPAVAVHLFVLYYIITTGITPPVCIVSWTAAALAQSPPMKTAFTAMRLAIVVYFVPFFFLFSPALVLQGPVVETLYLLALCLVGIAILAAGLEGYLLKIGKLEPWSRPLLAAAGFLIAFPHWTSTIMGVAMAAAVITAILLKRKAMSREALIS